MIDRPGTPPREVKIDFAPGGSVGEACIHEATLLTAHLRKIRFTVRSLDFVCSVFVIASVARALHLFFLSDVDLWPPGVDLSAQLFLLVVAVASFFFNSYIIFTYLIRQKGMRTTISRLELGFQLAVTVIFLGAFTMGAGSLALFKSGSLAGGKNIFKIACERAQTPSAPKSYWGICWTNEWAHVCGFIGAALNGVSLAFYVLIVVRFYQKRRVAKVERRAAEARARSLQHYNARGLQNPRLVSEMSKISLPPTA